VTRKPSRPWRPLTAPIIKLQELAAAAAGVEFSLIRPLTTAGNVEERDSGCTGSTALCAA
jgi:hypothetical protein